jgi:hypothetical protein
MSGLTDPFERGFAITPSDSANLSIFTTGLYVGTSGDVKVDLVSGDTLTFVAMASGVIHRLQVKKVYSTGTDASNLIGVY